MAAAIRLAAQAPRGCGFRGANCLHAYFFSGLIISTGRQGQNRMAERPQNILICSCEDTMPLDADAVRRGCGGNVVTADHLCREDLDRSRAGGAGGEPIIVGCTQEAPVLAEVASESENAPPLTFVN